MSTSPAQKRVRHCVTADPLACYHPTAECWYRTTPTLNYTLVLKHTFRTRDNTLDYNRVSKHTFRANNASFLANRWKTNSTVSHINPKKMQISFHSYWLYYYVCGELKPFLIVYLPVTHGQLLRNNRELSVLSENGRPNNVYFPQNIKDMFCGQRNGCYRERQGISIQQSIAHRCAAGLSVDCVKGSLRDWCCQLA